VVNKVTEDRPHVVDMIKNDEISFIINTTEDKLAIADSFTIRREALQHKVTYTTTLAGAAATARAMKKQAQGEVNRLQDLHQELNNG
jgi:carbamoyl-phosphate synthase large subunit